MVDCVQRVETALGRKLEPEELGRLKKKVDDFTATMRGEDLSYDDWLELARKFQDEQVTAAKINKIITAKNLKARAKATQWIKDTFPDNPGHGLEAFMRKSQVLREGTMNSVANFVETEMAWGLSLSQRLARQGLLKDALSGAFDRDIFRVMKAIDANQPVTQFDPKAVQIAQTLRDMNNAMVEKANRYGAFIGKIDGYVVAREHNAARIKGAEQAWKQMVLTRLDWDKSFDGKIATDRAEFVDNLLAQLSAGVHIKADEAPPSGFGTASEARALSHHRKMHFLSPDDDFEYMQQFGNGTLMGNWAGQAMRMGRSIGLMQKLGPSASHNYKQIVQDLMKAYKGDSQKLESIRDADRTIEREILPNLTGADEIPWNPTAAKGWSEWRALQGAAKLGAAALSAISDVMYTASQYRYWGDSPLAGARDWITAVSRMDGVPLEERIEALEMLGVEADTIAARISRFNVGDQIPGLFSDLQNKVFLYSGMSWVTESGRYAASVGHARRMAMWSQKGWGNLSQRQQDLLKKHGISDSMWDVIRQGIEQGPQGKDWLTPTGIEGLPDSVFSTYLTNQGVNPTNNRIKLAREEMSQIMKNMFYEISTEAINNPDTHVMGMMRRGTRPGDLVGEADRSFGQFKSFPVSVIKRTMGREAYGYGPEIGLVDSLTASASPIAGLTTLMMYSMIAGYISMTAKDLAKGREPRELNAKTLIAAFLQGGGAGLYGDFLFGEAKSRFGQDPITTFMGPTFGTASDIYKLYGRAKEGDMAASGIFNLVSNNTPFINLWYTRAAVDYLFLYRMKEWMNPGYLHRMEQRMMKENAQEMLYSPSSEIPYGGF